MTTRHVNQFRAVLEASVMELDSSARRRDAILIEASADRLEGMLRATERELAGRRLEAASAELREARAALRRIQEGTYGICQDCEETVSPARLSALPWAARCVRCQKAEDLRCRAKATRPLLALAA